ncbi:MAG: hypothetical protein ABSD47_07275 [Candidatus Methylomirabilota bacterium]|jgi:hypothetical protein
MPLAPRLDACGTVRHVNPQVLGRAHVVADGEHGKSVLARLRLSLAEAARQLGVSTSGTAKAAAKAERRKVH